MARRWLVWPALLLLGAAGPPSSDPDWPCMQRLVPVLTAGTYWSGDLPAEADWHADPRLPPVVAEVSASEESAERGEARLAAFASTLAPDERRKVLPVLFVGLVAATNVQRGAMIARIDELTRRQRGVARVVDRLSQQLLQTPADAAGPGGVSRDDITRQRDLVVRSFQEIQGTMRYACQAPVDLEARLGAYARTLQKAMQ